MRMRFIPRYMRFEIRLLGFKKFSRDIVILVMINRTVSVYPKYVCTCLYVLPHAHS